MVAAVCRAGKMGGVTPMNTLKRLMLGLLSSLLFAVGFVRAGERVDPLSGSSISKVKAHAVVARTPCSIPCWYEDDD